MNNEKAFISLFNKPEDFEMVYSSLEHTIMASFSIDYRVTGRQPDITQEKIKARWAICERWFRHMRGELGWGLIRTINTIPKALACELLDQEFKPEQEHRSAFWTGDINDIAGKLD